MLLLVLLILALLFLGGGFIWHLLWIGAVIWLIVAVAHHFSRRSKV